MASSVDKPWLPSLSDVIAFEQSSPQLQSTWQRQGNPENPVALPALSALTSTAESHPPVKNPPNRQFNVPSFMTYATTAPAATSGGQGSSPPICQNCSTCTTPLWRRDEAGSVLCNACGLFLKLHGRPRPISLKTDVIKSRNRVRTVGQTSRKKPATDSHGFEPETGTPPLVDHRRIPPNSHKTSSDFLGSPTRPGIHRLACHPSNIAPQHMFDGIANDSHSGALIHSGCASVPGYSFRHHSPGSTSTTNGSHPEPPPSYEALTCANTTLKTRVSELEVINDLFRGRVAELEQSEKDARHAEALARDAEHHHKLELNQSRSVITDLKRRIKELENSVGSFHENTSRQKKIRLSDIVDKSELLTRSSTPHLHDFD